MNKLFRRRYPNIPTSQKISDDDDVEKEDGIQEEGVSFVESLAMLDKMKKRSFLDDESQAADCRISRFACRRTQIFLKKCQRPQN